MTAVDIGSRSIDITWVEPHDNNAPILGYCIFYNHPSFIMSGSEVTMNVTVEEASLLGLHPGVTYNITVIAFNEEGDSFRSDVLSVRTLEKGDFIFCMQV